MPAAADPVFAVTPNHTSIVLNAAAETALDVPTKTVVVFTPGANGSLLLEIDVEVVHSNLLPVTVAGLIYVFLHTGATYTLFDTIAVAAVTATTSVAPWRATPKQYSPGIILKSGTTVEVSCSLQPTTGLFRAHAFGLDA